MLHCFEVTISNDMTNSSRTTEMSPFMTQRTKNTIPILAPECQISQNDNTIDRQDRY